MSLLAEESVSPTLPLTFPGEARGDTIKSSMTPFHIENALELELWIQMALKESTREGLQVLPDGGGAREAEAASERQHLGRPFLFSVQQETHTPPTPGLPHLPEVGLTERSHSRSHSHSAF